MIKFSQLVTLIVAKKDKSIGSLLQKMY